MQNGGLFGIIDRPEYDFGRANKNLEEHRSIWMGQSKKSFFWHLVET
jgi:hypothetical protein